MYFKYVIFCLSALLVQVIAGQNAGSSCCDTSGTVPQLFGNQSSNNATFVQAITSSGNSDQSTECSYLTEVFTLAGEDPCCDSAAGERYRRASNSNSAISGNGLSCTANLLKARLAVATAKARATAAANEQQEVIVAAKTVPVPTELTPPKLLHKQSINDLLLSPCPVNVVAPSCSCAMFEPSSSDSTNAVTILQKLGNRNGNNDANITNYRHTDLPRTVPPKPTASAGVCAVPIRIPDADERQTSTTTAADVVAARLAQHRLLTGQQVYISNSGQCPCSINLPVPCCGCPSSGSGNFISSNSVGSGGDFLVTSIGSESPPGIAVDTDVTLLGNLNVCGALPFVSAVEFEGLYDTIGSGSVSFGCDNSDPVTQNPLSNNAVTSLATINSCRNPDVPKAMPTLAAIEAGATEARIAEADERISSTNISPAAALSARLAQQRLLTGQQSTTGQCPQPRSLPTPICGCSSAGPSSFARANSMPITQKLGNPSSNYAALTTCVNNCRCPSLSGTLPAVAAAFAESNAAQSRTTDFDYQQTSATARAAAVSARLAHHRLLTGEQSREQCPRCNSSPITNSISSNGCNSPVIISSSSDGLLVTSIGSESSPGIAVETDVTLSGDLNVCGSLPFMSAVQFQGLYDTIGSGSVSFGCGESEPVTQKFGNSNANKAALGINAINSCSKLPKYTDTPRALSATAATEVSDLQTKTADADEKRATNMAAVVSARLAQHRLLTGPTAPNCGCGSSGKSNFVTIPSSVGSLPVTSISLEAPVIDVDADIGLFGNLNISGELPFQSAVEFQGVYDTFGSGTVSFGCDNPGPIKQMFEN